MKRRWSEHLDAARFGDLKAQQALGLEVDEQTDQWQATQDPTYLEHVSRRHRDGAVHWTGKSIAELVTAAENRGGSGREDWTERTRLLGAAQQRMLRVVSLGLHHSPSASQNWYARPHEMLLDPLRVAWIVFGLHARLGLEHFALEYLDTLGDLLARQAPAFSSPLS